MIREILTEWRPCTHTRPHNVKGEPTAREKHMEGQIDHNVVARVVREEIDHPSEVDENQLPVKVSRLAIEHKVVAEHDSAIAPIKEHDRHIYAWMRRRFALQFEELAGKTQGGGRIGTSLVKANVLPEAILTKFLHRGVTTVESLAHMTDTTLADFGPGMREWRERARDWLNAQDQQSEREAVDEAYASAEAEEKAEPKRKPGRPAKARPEAA